MKNKDFDIFNENMSTDGMEWMDELRKEMENLHKFVSKVI